MAHTLPHRNAPSGSGDKRRAEKVGKTPRTCPSCVLHDCAEIRLTLLIRMARTTGLEPATSALTVSGLQVLATTYQSTNSILSYCEQPALHVFNGAEDISFT